ncbi:hypothetical protein E0G74_01290 [Salmonella enterica]|nr:hypothetical protein [Salmonella enterica]ECB1886173.1 hypothetical protein [Salmonella enterica subsp. enterica serovar Mississippi]
MERHQFNSILVSVPPYLRYEFWRTYGWTRAYSHKKWSELVDEIHHMRGSIPEPECWEPPVWDLTPSGMPTDEQAAAMQNPELKY